MTAPYTRSKDGEKVPMKRFSMNPLLVLRAPAAVALVLLIGACATNRSGAGDAPAKEAPAKAVAVQADVSPDPRAAATPGGFWPPKPESVDAAPPAPLPKMLNTDGLVLDKLDAKAELKQRAIERWGLLIAGRGEDAFGYLTPGHQKTHDKVKYSYEMASRPVRWFRAAFDHAECATEDSCEVTLLVDFRVRMSAGMGVTESFAFVKERWIRTNGVWYHLPTDAGG